MRSVALLSHTTENLGDEIQTLAALQLVQQTSSINPADINYVNRDFSSVNPTKKPMLLIANGWFSHTWMGFPPSVTPLFISVHLSPRLLKRAPKQTFAYLKQHEPIGCRDIWTLHTLKEAGIQAYLSYCLSLSLDSKQICPPEHQNEIVYCDVPIQARRQTKTAHSTIETKLLNLSHSTLWPRTQAKRLEIARSHLNIYAHATEVVTSRLHCFLPCLAFKTPVTLTNLDYQKDERFTGYEALISCECPAVLTSSEQLQWLSDIQRFQQLVIQRSIALGEPVMKHIDLSDNLSVMVEQLDQLPLEPSENVYSTSLQNPTGPVIQVSGKF